MQDALDVVNRLARGGSGAGAGAGAGSGSGSGSGSGYNPRDVFLIDCVCSQGLSKRVSGRACCMRWTKSPRGCCEGRLKSIAACVGVRVMQ